VSKKLVIDRNILKWIAKSPADANPTTTPVANLMLPAQGYAVALVNPEDDLADLQAAMEEISPGARVARLEAPAGGDEASQHREFLNLLRWVAGAPALSETDDLDQAQAALPDLLYPVVDFLVVDHAERLTIPSLHTLRRHAGMPPTILIAYDTQFLSTLSRDLLLMRNVYFFQN
jgi:hypothetical protein